MRKKILGLFGDSYIAFPEGNKNWSRRIAENYDPRPWGKYGSNLFYAINCWHTGLENLNGDRYDYAIFTLTWHTRLYSINKDRNDYLCTMDDTIWDRGFHDPEIQTRADFDRFKNMVQDYHHLLYDDQWSRFRHELEIKYILDLPKQHPNTRFVFIPNTGFSREIALRYHDQGVLLDFAFEDISNNEPGCPGRMPLQVDHRINHISWENQEVMYQIMHDLLENYDQYQDQIVPIDLGKFHLDNTSDKS